MSKKKNFILLFLLVVFSVYCALSVGETWDQKYNLLRGKITLDYFFSIGKIDNDILARQNYSTIYWSFTYLITKIFPSQYQIEITNLVNLFFSICAIFGINNNFAVWRVILGLNESGHFPNFSSNFLPCILLPLASTTNCHLLISF